MLRIAALTLELLFAGFPHPGIQGGDFHIAPSLVTDCLGAIGIGAQEEYCFVPIFKDINPCQSALNPKGPIPRDNILDGPIVDLLMEPKSAHFRATLSLNRRPRVFFRTGMKYLLDPILPISPNRENLQQISHFHGRGGRLANVFYEQFADKIVLGNSIGGTLTIQIGSNLSLPDAFGAIGGSIGGINSSARSIQGASNVDHANTGYEDAHKRSYNGPESPSGHVPLRLEVLLAAPLIAFGLLISWWGLNAGDWRDTGVSNILKSAITILIGAAISTFGVSLLML